jgi:hypothetical protein
MTCMRKDCCGRPLVRVAIDVCTFASLKMHATNRLKAHTHYVRQIYPSTRKRRAETALEGFMLELNHLLMKYQLVRIARGSSQMIVIGDEKRSNQERY